MQAWDLFLQTLAQETGDAVIERWLRPCTVIHFDARNLYLEAPTPFHIEWFEEHVRPRAKKTFFNQNNHLIHIHLSLNGSAKRDKTSLKQHSSLQFTKDPIFQEYVLATFLFGKHEELLEQLLPKLFENSPASPLVFYGPSCFGKTHLLQALQQEYAKRGKQALYVRTSTFTEHLVLAIRTGCMQEFRAYYRNPDVLLVDDIHQLAKKSATQEEFFHTFNALHSLQKQIILSSNKIPSLLEEIEPRLISRFEWGLALPLPMFDKETLSSFARQQAMHFNLTCSDATYEFLLENFPNPSALQKALSALYLRTKEPITQINVRSLLQDLLQIRPLPSPQDIIRIVAAFFDITSEEILSRSQTKEHTFPRQISMLLCRTILHMPLLQIATTFQRDHSTVISSLRLLEKRMHEEEKTKSTIVHLEQLLQ